MTIPENAGRSHPHAAAVVQRHQGRAAGGIQQSVQQQPVGDRIRAVAHGFGFAVRLATEPSQWSRPMTIGAETSPLRTISLKARPSFDATPALPSRYAPAEARKLMRSRAMSSQW